MTTLLGVGLPPAPSLPPAKRRRRAWIDWAAPDAEVAARLFTYARIRVDLGPFRFRLQHPWFLPMTLVHELGHALAHVLLTRATVFVASTFVIPAHALPETFDAPMHVEVPRLLTWRDAVIAAAGPCADFLVGGLALTMFVAQLPTESPLPFALFFLALSYLTSVAGNLWPSAGSDGGCIVAWAKQAPVQGIRETDFMATYLRLRAGRSDPRLLDRIALILVIDALRESSGIAQPSSAFYLDLWKWRLYHESEPAGPE